MESTFEEKFKKLKEEMASLGSEAQRSQSGRSQATAAWSKEQRIQLAKEYEQMKLIKDQINKFCEEPLQMRLKFHKARQRLLKMGNNEPRNDGEQPVGNMKLKNKKLVKKVREHHQFFKIAEISVKKNESQRTVNNDSKTLHDMENDMKRSQDIENQIIMNNDVEQSQDIENQIIMNNDVEQTQEIRNKNMMNSETEAEESNDTQKIVSDTQEISEISNEPCSEESFNRLDLKRPLSEEEKQEKMHYESHKKIKLDSHEFTGDLHILASVACEKIQESPTNKHSQTNEKETDQSSSIPVQEDSDTSQETIITEEKNEFLSQATTDEVDEVNQKLDVQDTLHCSEEETDEDLDVSPEIFGEKADHSTQVITEKEIIGTNPRSITEGSIFEVYQGINSSLQNEDTMSPEIGITKNSNVKENSTLISNLNLETSSLKFQPQVDSEDELIIDDFADSSNDASCNEPPMANDHSYSRLCPEALSIFNNIGEKKLPSGDEENSNSFPDSNSTVSSISNDFNSVYETNEVKRKSRSRKSLALIIEKELETNPEIEEIIMAQKLLQEYVKQATEQVEK